MIRLCPGTTPDQAAVAHHQKVFRQAKDFTELVSDKDQRQPFLSPPAKVRQELMRPRCVEGRSRFIQDE
jgi:hypothetical protein